MKASALSYLRVFAILEGISYLAFGITMPMKYMADIQAPNYIVGMIHGLLFVGYCVLVLVVARKLKWKFNTTFYAGIASLLPFGTFVADAKIFKKERNR